MTANRIAYDLLSDIYKGGAYSNIALSKRLFGEKEAALITRLVLGVLERDVELEYIISKLTDKPPKQAVKILLKMGVYCLKYMDSMPDYAVVNGIVELSKELGKQGVSGFLNATLKAAAAGDFQQLPDKGDLSYYYSVKLSKPLWLVKRVFGNYSEADALKILDAKSYEYSHIRPNLRVVGLDELEALLTKKRIECFKSKAGGLYVKDGMTIKELMSGGRVTYQSEASMYAVAALGVQNYTNVLDLCAAPGGKTVYASELNRNGTVTATDIHPHRVELIKSYAERMKATNVTASVLDGTVLNRNFINRFDSVLVDAPCSGIGVIAKQPDILLNRQPADVKELSEIQTKLLDNAAEYVRDGGALVYSTCTVLKEENDFVVNAFLNTHPQFKLDKMDVPFDNDGKVQLLPKDGLDGFFIARMVKNG